MMRTGIGYDVHRLVPERSLILGGVEIPHELGLLGHSDADVLLHAICDALLGSLALGDIGQHFPDNDARYKNISSLRLLEHVVALIDESDYTIGNIDATIMAERPKLKGYIQAMRIEVAKACGVAIEQVSIKATTTEKLGFCGREEGIAAEAVVLVCAKKR